MVGGMERYYQIARCYRDEDFRADRQPEFTQLDIEMSFVDQEDVIELGEAIAKAVWAIQGGVDLTTPFPRITYREAMDKYGSDKPDLRFENPIVEVTEFFANTPVPGLPERVRRRDRDARWGGRPAPAYLRRLAGVGPAARGEGPGVRDGEPPEGELGGPVAKNISDTERAGLAEFVGAKPGDCIFFGAGKRKAPRNCWVPPGSRSPGVPA